MLDGGYPYTPIRSSQIAVSKFAGFVENRCARPTGKHSVTMSRAGDSTWPNSKLGLSPLLSDLPFCLAFPLDGYVDYRLVPNMLITDFICGILLV